jgi:NADH-quinone oxidoreductase subunit A
MDWQLIESAAPLILVLGLALSIPIVFIVVSAFLGPRKPSAVKAAPYECGLPETSVTGDARSRFNVKFYLVAVFFLVFDVEVVFLFPWAVWFQDQAWAGFGVMATFLAVLAFGWFYLLKRGALEWE